MAERQPFQARVPGINADISTHPSQQLGQELQEFGQRLAGLSARLGQYWVDKRVQEEGTKGTRDANAGTFKPVGDNTLAGQAYNNAGLQTYFDNLKLTTGDQVERIYNENKDDPAKLEKALGGFRDGTEAELTKTMPELVTPFRTFFERSSRPYMQGAAVDYQKRQDDQSRADTVESLTGMMRQHENRAFVAGDNVNAVADIALNRNDYLEKLISAGPKTEFTLRGKTYAADPSRLGITDVNKLEQGLHEYDQQIVEARYKGAGMKAIQAGRGDRYVLGLANSKHAIDDLGLDGRDSVVSWLRSQMSIQAGMSEAADKSVGQAVEAYTQAVVAGQTPGGGDQLRVATRGTKYEATFDALQKNQDELATFSRMRPDAQAHALTEAENKLAGIAPANGDMEGYTVALRAQNQLVRWMQQSHADTIKALQTDGFAFAQQSGVVPQQPPIVNQDGTLNADGLALRTKAAAFASNYYQMPIAPISKGEAAQLARGIQLSGTDAVAGQDPQVMREAVRLMEPDYPQVAQMTSFAINGRRSPVSAGGDGADVSKLLLRGYTLTEPIDGSKPLFVLKDTAKTGFEEAFNRYVGDAFTGNAAARARAQDGVLAVYAAYSENAPDGLSGAFDGKTFKRAAAAYFGGRKVRINGGDAFAPYGMDADHFELGLRAGIAQTMRADGYTPDQIEPIIRHGAPQNAEDGYYILSGDAYVTKHGTKNEPLKFRPISTPEVDQSVLVRDAMAHQSEPR